MMLFLLLNELILLALLPLLVNEKLNIWFILHFSLVYLAFVKKKRYLCSVKNK